MGQSELKLFEEISRVSGKYSPPSPPPPPEPSSTHNDRDDDCEDYDWFSSPAFMIGI